MEIKTGIVVRDPEPFLARRLSCTRMSIAPLLLIPKTIIRRKVWAAISAIFFLLFGKSGLRRNIRTKAQPEFLKIPALVDDLADGVALAHPREDIDLVALDSLGAEQHFVCVSSHRLLSI